MEQGGHFEQGRCADSKSAENEFAQDVRVLARGPTRGNEALPQIYIVVVMEMFIASQSRLDDMEARWGRQSTVNNHPIAPPAENVQPAPQAPPPPLPPRE